MGGKHGRFPNLAFLALAIAQKRDDGMIVVVDLQTSCQATRNREALAERSRGNLDAGNEARIGVPLQTRAELAQRDELLDREIACMCERCVKRRRCMTFRKDEAVAVGSFRVLRVVLENAAEI